MRFCTALNKRNEAYKKFRVVEREYYKRKGIVSRWDCKCNSLRNMWDKWEPKFPIKLNFSGWED